MNAAQRRDWREYVYGCPDLTTAQRLVLLALAEFADWPDGTNAYPGSERLAEICGLKLSAVEKALARGRELKLIQQTQPAKPKRGWAAVYRLLPTPAITRTAVRVMDGYCPYETELLPVRPDAITRTAVRPTKPLTPSHNTGGRAREDAQRAAAPQAVKDDDPNNPRCPKHRQTTGWVEEDCPDCAKRRARIKAVEAKEAEAKRLAGKARRQAIDECGLCDPQGMLELPTGLDRCKHPEAHRVIPQSDEPDEDDGLTPAERNERFMAELQQRMEQQS